VSYKNDTGLCSVTQCFLPYLSWDHITPAVLTNAADRGSRVHQALADEINGEFTVVDADIKGYVAAGRKFLEMVDETVLVEQRLTSDVHQFTGQVDLVCRIKGDKCLTLVDWKTSATLSKSWPLQLAAYGHLANANAYPLPPGTRYMAIQLRRNGTFIVREYTNPAHDFAIFLNVLSAWKYFNPKPIFFDFEEL